MTIKLPYLACQVNEYSNSGFSPCLPCPPGYYQGIYSWYYQPYIGQTSCTGCGVNSTNDYCISAGIVRLISCKILCIVIVIFSNTVINVSVSLTKKVAKHFYGI